MPQDAVWTLAEVGQHNTPEDLWMVIYDSVYDITPFLDAHPGGAEVLFDCGGVDALEAFDDVCHSDDAIAMLAPYKMGELLASEVRRRRRTDNRTVWEVLRCEKRGWKGGGRGRDLLVVALTALCGFVWVEFRKWN